MKKHISLMLVCILSLTLAACRGDAPMNEQSSKNPSPTQTESPAPQPSDSNNNSEIDNDSTHEILEMSSFDGYILKGRLVLPEGKDSISKLVIFVNGSSANTYLNRRVGFNFFDTFADEFSDLGIAFFSYNTRGVSLGDSPPMFYEINEEGYQTYLPLNQVEDIFYMINALKENERLKDCKVYLLGASEGTIIAPLVAEKYPDAVDALFLWGYANQNMKDVLIWQNSGGSSMVWYRAHFESDAQGRIDKESYEADPNSVIASILGNAAFNDLDVNNDGYLDEKDFTVIMAESIGFTIDDILSAIEKKDDMWLRNNYGLMDGVSYIPLTSAWFLEHFSLRSNMDVLPLLDLPVYIFHGTLDQNVDVRGVFQIYEKFRELEKTNLTINVFENHDHNLNYFDIILYNTMPEGLQAIFDAIAGK